MPASDNSRVTRAMAAAIIDTKIDFLAIAVDDLLMDFSSFICSSAINNRFSYESASR